MSRNRILFEITFEGLSQGVLYGTLGGALYGALAAIAYLVTLSRGMGESLGAGPNSLFDLWLTLGLLVGTYFLPCGVGLILGGFFGATIGMLIGFLCGLVYACFGVYLSARNQVADSRGIRNKLAIATTIFAGFGTGTLILLGIMMYRKSVSDPGFLGDFNSLYPGIVTLVIVPGVIATAFAALIHKRKELWYMSLILRAEENTSTRK